MPLDEKYKETLGDLFTELNTQFTEVESSRDSFKNELTTISSKLSKHEKMVGALTADLEKARGGESEQIAALVSERDQYRAQHEDVSNQFAVYKRDLAVWDKAKAAGMPSQKFLRLFDLSGITFTEDKLPGDFDKTLAAWKKAEPMAFLPQRETTGNGSEPGSSLPTGDPKPDFKNKAKAIWERAYGRKQKR